MKKMLFVLLGVLVLSACGESETERKHRLATEAQQHRDDVEREVDRALERRNQTEKEEKAERAKYPPLETGATPWKVYYGGNPDCYNRNCSEIVVITDAFSDVVVIIKRDEKVVRHAYIRSDKSYTFSLPNGTYQVFFYSGNGWNADKEMKNGEMKGGFMWNGYFSKDDIPQKLENSRLTYELITQKDGNFQTTPSDGDEAL